MSNIGCNMNHIFITMETIIVTPSKDDCEYMELAKTQITEEMLNIKDFVKITEYNIDPLIIDEQWQMLNTKSADELIKLTPQMLERLNFLEHPLSLISWNNCFLRLVDSTMNTGEMVSMLA